VSVSVSVSVSVAVARLCLSCLPLCLSLSLYVCLSASASLPVFLSMPGHHGWRKWLQTSIKNERNEPKPYTGASRLEEMATNVDACIMCCPLNLHTKGLLGAKVSVLVCVLICALVCDLICVLIFAHLSSHICALMCALYGSLYVPFCVSHVHVCPCMCPCMCPCIHYLAFSITQTHTHQVMGAMRKGALIVNVARGGIDRIRVCIYI
jgi:hypothetical protein